MSEEGPNFVGTAVGKVLTTRLNAALMEALSLIKKALCSSSIPLFQFKHPVSSPERFSQLSLGSNCSEIASPELGTGTSSSVIAPVDIARGTLYSLP